jgi:hypothetical protein
VQNLHPRLSENTFNPFKSISESYAVGKNTLSAFTASSPVCLYPKIRSIHSLILLETMSLSNAALNVLTNSDGV